MEFLKFATIAILLLFSTQAFALVDMQNANFNTTFIDVQDEGLLTLERTYNSRSMVSGIYGFGWCTEYDAKISFDQGSIVYSLADCEEEKRFDLTPASLKILESLSIKPEDLPMIIKTEPNRLNDQKLVWAAKDTLIPENVNSFSIQLIKSFTSSGSQITSDNNALSFDWDGRLTHLQNDDIEYNMDGKISKATDTKNNVSLTFTYPDPLTMVITYSKLPKTPVICHFDEHGDLRSVKNIWGKTYLFDYDDLHNLTTAIWPDGSSIAVGYNTTRDWVVTFKDRDQCVEQYNYTFRGKTENRLGSEVFKKCEETSQIHHYYLSRYDGPASDHTSKLTTLNIMKERWGALQTNRTFLYDDLGRVLSIFDTEYGVVSLEQIYFDQTPNKYMPDQSTARLDDTKLIYDEPVIYIMRSDDNKITIEVLAKGGNEQSLIDEDNLLITYVNSSRGFAEKNKGFYKLLNRFSLFNSQKAFLESDLDGYVMNSASLPDEKNIRYAGKKIEISWKDNPNSKDFFLTTRLFSGDDIKGKQTLEEIRKKLPAAVAKRIEDTQKYIKNAMSVFLMLRADANKSNASD